MHEHVDPGLAYGPSLADLLYGRLQEQQPWRRSAACIGMDPNLFFPTQGEVDDVARETCARCPVRTPCTEHAVMTGEVFGTWGGLSQRARARLRRSRKTAV